VEHGGHVVYKANVKQIVTEGSGEGLKAVGVKLADGRVFRGKTVGAVLGAAGARRAGWGVEGAALRCARRLLHICGAAPGPSSSSSQGQGQGRGRARVAHVLPPPAQGAAVAPCCEWGAPARPPPSAAAGRTATYRR
jgi:hypothetical protein